MSEEKIQRKKKKAYPTLFALEGGIRMADRLSMLELHTKITTEEWQHIILETVEYYTFLRALKDVGMPALSERWTKVYEYFREGLEVSIGRMRNIDPLLLARIDQEALYIAYCAKMKAGAADIMQQARQIQAELGAMDISIVSDM